MKNETPKKKKKETQAAPPPPDTAGLTELEKVKLTAYITARRAQDQAKGTLEGLQAAVDEIISRRGAVSLDGATVGRKTSFEYEYPGLISVLESIVDQLRGYSRAGGGAVSPAVAGLLLRAVRYIDREGTITTQDGEECRRDGGAPGGRTVLGICVAVPSGALPVIFPADVPSQNIDGAGVAEAEVFKTSKRTWDDAKPPVQEPWKSAAQEGPHGMKRWGARLRALLPSFPFSRKGAEAQRGGGEK